MIKFQRSSPAEIPFYLAIIFLCTGRERERERERERNTTKIALAAPGTVVSSEEKEVRALGDAKCDIFLIRFRIAKVNCIDRNGYTLVIIREIA